jgi:hypothetical protein
MKIAVMLSGTIRFHHKSLNSIEMLKSRGDQVDVFMHTWSNVADTVAQSWSHREPTEPTDELLKTYCQASLEIDDWMAHREKYVAAVDLWRRECGLKTFTNYGMLGMFYGASRAYCLAPRLSHDLYVRLRFDTQFVDNPLDFKGSGDQQLVIPNCNDYWGINDQVAWYWRGSDDAKSERELGAYFDLYHAIPDLIRRGVEYNPEVLLKARLVTSPNNDNVPIHRPMFGYTIHGD